MKVSFFRYIGSGGSGAAGQHQTSKWHQCNQCNVSSKTALSICIVGSKTIVESKAEFQNKSYDKI